MPTSAERAAWGRIGGHIAHAMHDSAQLTAPARRAFLDKFEREVDPDGELEPSERARRAEHARKAHMQRLAMKSVAARRRKSGTTRSANSGPANTSAA
jgi:hypothetical protein